MSPITPSHITHHTLVIRGLVLQETSEEYEGVWPGGGASGRSTIGELLGLSFLVFPVNLVSTSSASMER